jgi:hypothetical protein
VVRWGLVRPVLAIAGLFLVVQAVLVVFGPLTVNDEIECGSLYERATTVTGRDEALCRTALAEQRVWAAGCTALAALSLIGVFLVPRRVS